MAYECSNRKHLSGLKVVVNPLLIRFVEGRTLKAYGLAYAFVVGPKLLKILLSIRRTHKNRHNPLSAVSVL